MSDDNESMAQSVLALISDTLSGNLVNGLHTRGPLEVTQVENAHDVFYVQPSGIEDDNATSAIGFFGHSLSKQDRPAIDFQVGTVDPDVFNTLVQTLSALGLVTLGDGWPG